uniref:Cytochrome c domain-containing protein n=1 Tax=Rhodopseudomonas palustris (strain BisA53) TaxID=316055 RepID=Q07I53_RHOP5
MRTMLARAVVAAPHFAAALALTTAAHAQTPIFVDQGTNWTAEARTDFYGRDQGSRMIALSWLKAFKQPNGQPFLDGSLARYGYLPNPANQDGLPVGFTSSGAGGTEIVGMTCSACHTRQISAEGKTYRIDGGPAIVDFQTFLSDLDVAAGQVVASDASFKAFASAVLQSANPDPDDVLALRAAFDLWYLRYHTLVSRALPPVSWGPSRLDAVGMIFNRLTGLDLGPPPSLLIADNIKVADAPVRYPFLWNAPIQDMTQWPGFADNGNDILALSRNLGEVFGVFGVFEPVKIGFAVNFLNNNSANFDGLGKLEDLVKKIGPPKWPWLIDTNLAAKGKEIYARSTAQGGCTDCHGIRPGKVRFFEQKTWATPIQNVGTDTREYDIMAWTAKTGVLEGAFIPFVTSPLGPTDLAFNILATSVIGSIAEQFLSSGTTRQSSALVASAQAPLAGTKATSGTPQQQLRQLPPELRDLRGAFHGVTPPPTSQPDNFSIQGMRVPTPMAAPAPPPKGAYEARVMQGIWAAAPYLHNGSVPTLAELLKPAAQRVKQFKIGSSYDTVNVGLAVEQSDFDYTLVTTDCSKLNSGSSNCGHEFGTQLPDADKKALLEYLKTL